MHQWINQSKKGRRKNVNAWLEYHITHRKRKENMKKKRESQQQEVKEGRRRVDGMHTSKTPTKNRKGGDTGVKKDRNGQTPIYIYQYTYI
jgi:hypothetical protein